jgi:hypothetical protein
MNNLPPEKEFTHMMFCQEVWLDIPDYEGLYQASSFGRIRSIDRKILCKDGRSKLIKGTTLTPTKTKHGYLALALCCNGVPQTHTVHKLVSRAFLGFRPEQMQVNHLDGNKSNNAASNLEYCTPSENTRHAFRTGLNLSKGEVNPSAKLKANDIKSIVARASNGETLRSIAASYGLVVSSIWAIVNNKAWRHIER